MKTLSEKRKADRAEMAKQVSALCDKYAIPYEIENLPNEIWVRIETKDGLALTVDFDGKSCQPNTFVLSWHFKKKNDLKISRTFTGDRNEFHKRKATAVCYGFEGLMEGLELSFDKINNGVAFEKEEID